MKIREGPRVLKDRFDTLDAALEHIEAVLRPVAAEINRETTRALMRDVEPEDQVAARGELSGPHRLRAGIDVRGDGSTVAFMGTITRKPIAPDGHEDGFQALRRAIDRPV